MQYTLYKTKDNVTARLDADIGAASLSIPLQPGEGALFPNVFSGAATSSGSATVLNSTGIGSTDIAVGDFIISLTDGSHAFVMNIEANSITTTKLKGGVSNLWNNSDSWIVNPFVVTLNVKGTSGMTKNEKVLIHGITSDTLNVPTGGRGFDGSTPDVFVAGSYVELFSISLHQEEAKAALAELAIEIKELQDTAPSALEKNALRRLLDFNVESSMSSLDITVKPGIYNSAGATSLETPLTLTASQVNYVQIHQVTGVVTSNTTAFTPATHLSLWQITTDGSGSTLVEDKRGIYGDNPGGSTAPSALEDSVTAGEDISLGDVTEISAASTIQKFRGQLECYRKETVTTGHNNVRKTFSCALSESLVVNVSANTNQYPSVFATIVNRSNSNIETTHTSGALVQIVTSSNNDLVIVKGLERIDSTRCLMWYTYGNSTSTYKQYLRVISVSGTSVTLGTAIELDTINFSSHYSHSAAMIGVNKCLAIYATASGIYSRVYTISGTNLSGGTATQITVSTPGTKILTKVVALDADKALAIYQSGADIKGRVLSITGTSNTANTETTLLPSTSGEQENYELISPYFEFGDADFAYLARFTTTTNARIWRIDVSGTTPSISSPFDHTVPTVRLSDIYGFIRGTIKMVSSDTFVLNMAIASGFNLHSFRWNGSSVELYGSIVNLESLLNTTLGTQSPVIGVTRFATGELFLCVSVGSGNPILCCIRVSGAVYGISKAAYTSGNPAVAVVAGLATMAETFTAGQRMYVGFGGRISPAYTEQIPIGVMKSSTSLLFRP